MMLEEVYGQNSSRRRYVCQNGRLRRDGGEGQFWRKGTSKFIKVVFVLQSFFIHFFYSQKMYLQWTHVFEALWWGHSL